MTPKKPTTVTTVLQAKEQAKQLKRTMHLPTVGASLNQLAKMNGFKNWNAMRMVLINDEPIKGQSLYTLDVNEQAFRAAGIIASIPVNEINHFVSWFNVNFSESFRNIPFFPDNRKIIDILNNQLTNPMTALYAFVAFNGMQNIDRLVNLKNPKMSDISFEDFLEKYITDLYTGNIDFSSETDFFVALNDQIYVDFPEIVKAFKGGE